MPVIIAPKKPSPPAPAERLAVNATEAAALLGVTDRTLRNWTRKGAFHPRRIGGRLLYSMESLRAFLDGPADTPKE